MRRFHLRIIATQPAPCLSRPASQSGPIFVSAMTIVHYDYRPKRPRKAKPAVEFPCGRIVTARSPRKRHYDEIRRGVPDQARRTGLIKQFMARTLRAEGVPR